MKCNLMAIKSKMSFECRSFVWQMYCNKTLQFITINYASCKMITIRIIILKNTVSVCWNVFDVKKLSMNLLLLILLVLTCVKILITSLWSWYAFLEILLQMIQLFVAIVKIWRYERPLLSNCVWYGYERIYFASNFVECIDCILHLPA